MCHKSQEEIEHERESRRRLRFRGRDEALRYPFHVRPDHVFSEREEQPENAGERAASTNAKHAARSRKQRARLEVGQSTRTPIRTAFQVILVFAACVILLMISLPNTITNASMIYERMLMESEGLMTEFMQTRMHRRECLYISVRAPASLSLEISHQAVETKFTNASQ